MKRWINLIVLIVAALLGLALGQAIRRHQPAATDVAVSAVQTSAVDQKSSLFRHRKDRSTAAPPANASLADRLQHDLSMSSGVTRWLYWLEAIEKASLDDFPRLARLAKGNSIAARLVAARWVELDPRHMFDAVVAAQKDRHNPLGHDFTSVLFEEWPKRDMDAVIAALGEAKEFGRNWRMNLVNTLFNTDVERGLKLMSDWNIENYGPNMAKVGKWAAADPRHAAQFTLAHPAGYASRSTMEAIGKEWAKSDPAGAMAFAVTHPGELGVSLGNAAMKSWSERNLNEAAEWLANSDPKTRNRLSAPFVEAWGQSDAASALSWAQTNLAGRAQSRAIGALMKGAAQKNLSGAAELVLSMPPSAARAEAAAAVGYKWFPDYNSDKPVSPEMIKWLGTMDNASVRRTLEENYWRWSESDPKSMAAFLATGDPERIPPHALTSLSRSLARKNPEEAMTWAGQLPEERRQSAGNDVFHEWQQSQPESAFRWLNGLSAGDGRRDQFLQTAVQNMAHHPQGEQQLGMIAKADRPAASKVIEKMSYLDSARRDKLLKALK